MINPYITIKENGHKYLYTSEYFGFIHPTVQFLGPVTLGLGVIIEENCILHGGNFLGHQAVMRPGCVLGKGSELRVKAWMAENSWVGQNSVIYNYANVSMGTVIEDYVYFGVRSTTTNANDIVLHRNRPFIPNPVRIKSGTRIATHVCINPGVTIGRNSLVGAGSLVTKDVPSHEIWFGSPASKRGEVDKNDKPSAWMDSEVEKANRR